MEIDLVGHEGGYAIGEHACALTVTDLASGWTENRSAPNKAQKCDAAITRIGDPNGTKTVTALDRAIISNQESTKPTRRAS